MSRTILVHGPPGTGKTSFLARQAKLAAAKHGTSSVAIASLTRAAASEIAGRDTGIPDDNVGTLHAHAYRALNQPDLAETPDAITDWNATHPATPLTAGGRLDDNTIDAGERTRADELHQAVNTRRNRMQPLEQWTPDERAHFHSWSEWKHGNALLDFTDLIDHATRLPQHPNCPAVMLLDEAQDFSRLELQLAAKWAPRTDTTVLAGDPDQAIYSWRGADPKALYELTDQQQVLGQSHRVSRAVHQAANTWIGQIPDRRPVDYQPADRPGQIRRSPAHLANPAMLLPQLEQDLAGGGTVMVLASCGYLLAPLLRDLKRQAVPFQNPYRADHGGWNPMRGARRLQAFLEPEPWTWKQLHAWTEPLAARRALGHGAKTLIDEHCTRGRFGERRELEHPSRVMLEAVLGSTDPDHPARHRDVDWWERNLRATRKRQMTYPLAVLRRRGVDELRARPRLVVGTIHSVKGGEADHVYLFPDLSRTGMWHGWHQAGPARAAIVRAVYVAITRARDTFTVLAPSRPEHVPTGAIA